MNEKTLSRREVVTGLALLSAAGVAAARKPNISLDYLGKQTLEKVVPEQIGRWKFVSSSGLVVPPKDQLALAIYAQTLTRVYYDGTTPIMLLVAYSASQSGFLQVHRPEFCYTAAGYTLSDAAPHEVRLSPETAFRVNTLSANRDGQGEKLLYWTRIGNHIPLSWTEQKLVFAADNMRRIIPDSALVRVSTPIGYDRPPLVHLEEFVREMIAATAPSLRRVLVV